MERIGKDDPRRVGPYRLLGRVGSGGMGHVYIARSRCGPVAVKVIHDEYAVDPEFRTRFAREVELLRRVRSPYLPACLGADPAAPRPWLAAEYVPGLTLREWVRRNGPLPAGLLPAFAAAVAQALAAVHAAGVVHRDLKPGNVVLAADGPKVLDFGIARAVEESAITRTGVLVGTPGWISPEQYDGRPLGPAADMFAWGGLVAFAATGRTPFGQGVSDALAHRAAERPPDLAGVPGEWRGLLASALDKDPRRRPSARQVLCALHRRPSPDHAATADLIRRTWTIPAAAPALPPRPLTRRPILAAAVLAAALVGGLGLWELRGGPEAEGGRPTDTGAAAGEQAPTDAAAEEPIDWLQEAPEFATEAASTEAGEAAARIGGLQGEEAQRFADVPGTERDPESAAVVTLTTAAGETLRLLFYEVLRPGDEVWIRVGILQRPSDREVLGPEMFHIAAPGAGGRMESQRPQFPAPPDSAGLPVFTLVFPEAPERGLLTVEGPTGDDSFSGVPPVGVCYTASAWSGGGDTGAFSTEYARC